MISKLHYWFKTLNDLVEQADFVFWWSFIWKGLLTTRLPCLAFNLSTSEAINPHSLSKKIVFNFELRHGSLSVQSKTSHHPKSQHHTFLAPSNTFSHFLCHPHSTILLFLKDFPHKKIKGELLLT